MILKGSQRGGAMALAGHLLKDENDHVTVHEVRGFVADDVRGAFKEACAVSKGTKCKQFLFSLSLNPPQNEAVGEAVFEDAAARVEERLGLKGQPRVIVFHEKEGRRHAHVVWSRINSSTMTAVNLSNFKRKLMSLSKELYLEHGWNLPKGFRDPSLSNPLNFTLAEWQQAARHKRDPRELKQLFQKAWQKSDDVKAFSKALNQYGFVLARGDRRGFVAVDYLGGVYSIAKYVDLRTKAVRLKLGDAQSLHSIEESKVKLRESMRPMLKAMLANKQERYQGIANTLKREVKEVAARHERQRQSLKLSHSRRARQEREHRQSRYSTGIAAVWEALTGKRQFLKKQIEFEAWQCLSRDQQERDDLIFQQINERQDLQKRIENSRADYRLDRKMLGKQIGNILSLDRARIAAWHDERAEREQNLERIQKQSPSLGRDGPSFF